MIDKTAQIESLIEKHDSPITANPKGDKFSIFVLLVLYTLQGIPLGFSLAIPIIIQNMPMVSFTEQAKFSLAVWPFSMKLLWAPLVDSLFIRKLGRRKSWLIPVQYFLGLFFFVTGFHINKWLVNASKPEINALTVMFFILNFLAATQDIIVDGWALTMLRRENLSYSAVCNGAGQGFGIFLGYNLLVVLVSEKFWNKWWRTSPLPGGVITLQGYMYFWGAVFVIVTTLVAIFKPEKDQLTDKNISVDLSIIKTYKLLFRILKLPSIKLFAIILLTIKMSFSAIDASYKLKLIQSGHANDEIVTIEFLFIPVRLSLPFFIVKFTSKEKPLEAYFNTIPYRLIVGLIFTIVIYFTPYFLSQTGALLITYKICLVFIYFMHQLMLGTMMLTAMSFYASISDPKIGGTNMTLLSTISNLGDIWSKTGALWLIDFLTFKQCSHNFINQCSSKSNVDVCLSYGGKCQVLFDGFYLEIIMCTVYGVLWYCIFRKPIDNLQSKNVKEWHVKLKETF